MILEPKHAAPIDPAKVVTRALIVFYAIVAGKRVWDLSEDEIAGEWRTVWRWTS